MKRSMMALVAGTLAAPALAGGVLEIDGFDEAFSSRPFQGTSLLLSSDLFPLTGTTVGDTQTGLSVLGGERRATFSANPIYPAAGPYNDIADISGSQLSVTTGDNFGSLLVLEYGFSSGLDLDLAALFGAGGSLEFTVNGDQDAPPRPFPVAVSLTSGLGTMAEATAAFEQAVLADGLYSIGFGSFTGLDFGDIDSITIEIDLTGQEAVDVRFGTFRFVPAPSSVALLGLGGLVAGRRRR